jgi:starvation-inducible DNA-binding protein
MSTVTHEKIEVSLAAVSGPQRETNHSILQPVLTDLIAYGLSVKQLHWNIVGPNFRPIHLHLDEIYEEVQDAIDLVAERLSATGHSPNGTSQNVANETELKDVPTGFIRDHEVLLHASERTRELIGLIRSRMASIEDIDTVTADILHGIVATLEKQHWMIQAQRV